MTLEKHCLHHLIKNWFSQKSLKDEMIKIDGISLNRALGCFSWNTDQFSIAESSVIKQYGPPDEGWQIKYGMPSKIWFSDK